MGRMLWIAVGAAGGVVAYRKGKQLLDEAKVRGVVGSVQAATGTAADAASGARSLVNRALASKPSDDQGEAAGPSRPTGAAAARALAESRRPGQTSGEKAGPGSWSANSERTDKHR
jgi:hypothetical protein